MRLDKKDQEKLQDIRVKISDAIDQNKNALYVDLGDTSIFINDILLKEGYKILLITDDEQIVFTW